MTAYTITITPEGADGTTTTLRPDMTRGAATLTDVHLNAGAGLSAGQPPMIDYVSLLRAVGQESAAPATATAARKATARGQQPVKPRSTEAVRPVAARRQALADHTLVSRESTVVPGA